MSLFNSGILAHWAIDDQGFLIMETLKSIDNEVISLGELSDGHTHLKHCNVIGHIVQHCDDFVTYDLVLRP